MEKKLTLTDTERLILANQYKIISKLERMESGTCIEGYDEVAEQLLAGHVFLYEPHLSSQLAEELDEATTEHVLSTLELFRNLYDSYQKLGPAACSNVRIEDVSFHGFDGNNEAEMLFFAEALAKAGRYSETLGRCGELNSHSPTREIYGRMLQAWREIGKPHYPLTAEQIGQIVAARVHPSYR